MKDELSALVVKAAALKRAADQAALEYDSAAGELIEAMKTAKRATVTGIDVEAQLEVKGSLVEGTRITIDEAGLKKALGATKWDKVTKRVLDKQKLEAQMVAGEISPVTVSACTTESDNKPYVRWSMKKAIARKGLVVQRRTQSDAAKELRKVAHERA